MLEQHTRRPCFGVLPYIESLRIDQEDSVSLDERAVPHGAFRVGVIRLPHISNYTDFNALETIPDVAVEYLTEPTAAVDLLIIPGTKNTISDLQWLYERGFKPLLFQTLERGGWVLGICGGYQMLGRKISDPFGVEEGGCLEGLRLLPAETELGREKVTVQSQGCSFLGTSVSGYEIHMGRTEPVEPVDPFIRKQDGTADGIVCGRIAGTYFHGLFDNPEFTQEFLSLVAKSRRLTWRPPNFRYSKDEQYDRLAAAAIDHLDIDRIYELLQ